MSSLVIPYSIFRSILSRLRQQPYHVAVGETGLNLTLPDEIEVLVRSFRLIHEGALRRTIPPGPCFEFGFVPFTLHRPDVWQAVAFAARMEGHLPVQPTCSIMLGSGEEVGLVTGIVSVRDQIYPVKELKIVGPGMHRLMAVDFLSSSPENISGKDAERWNRLIGALGGSEVWQRFTNLTYAIIGTGRTGSLVAETLARERVCNLFLIDPDELQVQNLDAMSSVTEIDLGHKKASAIARNLAQELPYMQIVASPRSVLAGDVQSLLKNADLLICCVDDDVARLAVGALACRYLKPLLDVGTGVFFSSTTDKHRSRQLGADIRLILPGDGCLLCWGGVVDFQDVLGRLRTGTRSHRPWYEERAGSLRSLNAIAAHVGIRLIEDLVAGRLTRSIWLRYENNDQGIPSLQSLPSTRRTTCPLCSYTGMGDRVPTRQEKY